MKKATPQEIQIQEILNSARNQISNGKPSDALENVLKAIRLTEGGNEEAIFKYLDAAREHHASLMAASEFSQISSEENQLRLAKLASAKLVEESSLLSEFGDGSEVILQQAFEDGSSVICQKCGALIPKNRWIAHSDFWCEKNNDNDDNDDDNDD